MPYLWILLGYLVGATPFGFLAGKMKGIDIREEGSGNIGATNVMRVLGKRIGIPVFVLDVLKGVGPVLLARVFANEVAPQGLIPALTCVATILGHNYTFWLGFKGGKGIATSAGALLPIMPLTILIALVLWCLTFFTTRYVSLASLVAAVTLPSSILVQRFFRGDWQLLTLCLAAFIGAMGILKHRSNIERLLAGTENRFERKKKEAAPEADS